MKHIKVYYYSDYLDLDNSLKSKIEQSFGELRVVQSEKAATGVGGGGIAVDGGQLLQIGIYIIVPYAFIRFVDGFLNEAGSDLWKGIKKLYKYATDRKNSKFRSSAKHTINFYLNLNFENNHVHFQIPVDSNFEFEKAVDTLLIFLSENAKNINLNKVTGLEYENGKWKASYKSG